MAKHRRKLKLRFRIILSAILMVLIALLLYRFLYAAHSNTAQSEAAATASVSGTLPLESASAPASASTPAVDVWLNINTDLYQDPSSDSTVLASLPRGTKLQKVENEGTWVHVIVGDQSGYVILSALSSSEIATNGHIVVLDPGHQIPVDNATEPLGPGSDVMKAKVATGTHGTTTGVPEYELTMTICQQLRTELENRGYIVYLTHESNDEYISNIDRAEFANNKHADIFVRIHADGSLDSNAYGASALFPTVDNPWVGSLSGESERLSTDILTAYCDSTGMSNRGNSPRDDMTGFNWATMPMTLLEMGFMTNPTDDVNMENTDYQVNMVQGIANGIDHYFG